jgi:hypothetical protein
MPRNIMNHRLAVGARRYLFLVGLPVVAGCSWKTPTPADYVPPDVASEAWIIATPNPIPAGRGPGKTIVNWHTGDGSSGQVYLSVAGGPERLFSTNPSHQEATINSNDVYEFRLYAGSDHTTRLAKVEITRDRPARGQSPRDRPRRRDPR